MTEPGGPSPAVDEHHRSRHRQLLAVGALIAIILRYLLSLRAVLPEVVADETAYLSMARYLSGGPVWNLGTAATYGPGYSVLIAPLFRLGLSPEDTFRAVVMVNALLGGALVLALEGVVRRLTAFARPASIAVATVAACLPALVVTANHAWSDNLAPVTFAVLLLALLRLMERPSARRAVVLVLVEVAAYGVHGRFAPLAVVVLAVLAILAWQRRLSFVAAGVATVTMAAGMYVVSALSDRLYDALYDPGGALTQTTMNLDRVLRVGPLTISASGQLWYLVITTAGLAGFGAVALARSSWRQAVPVRRRLAARFGEYDRTVAPPRFDDLGLRAVDGLTTAVVVAMIGISFVVSAGFMADRPRPDQLVYGRYNDTLVGPLFVLGFAALATSVPLRRRLTDLAWVVAMAVATGALVWTTRFEVLKGPFAPTTILGLLAIEELGTQRLRVATAIGVVLILVVVAVSLLPRRTLPALLVLTAMLVGVGSWRASERYRTMAPARPQTIEALAGVIGPDDVVWFALAEGASVHGLYRFPFYAPQLRTRTINGGPVWDQGHEFVMADADQPDAVANGYRLVWVDPSSANALWVGPGDRQDELAAEGDLLSPAGLSAPAPGDDTTTIEFVEPPVSDGERVAAVVEVDRPTTEPWPTLGPGGDPQGRVRIGVQLIDPACDCAITEGRQDFDHWVDGDDDDLVVDLDVAFPDVPPGDYSVSVQILRENVARFGEDARAPVTVPA